MDAIWNAIWTIFAVGFWAVETAFKYLWLPALALFGMYILFGLVHTIEDLSADLRAIRGSVEEIKTAVDDIKTTLDDVKDGLDRVMFQDKIDVPDAE